MKRLVSLLFMGVLCASMLAPSAPASGERTTSPLTRSAGDDPRAEASAPRELTQADRQELQRAQQSADPELQDLRGGHLVVVLLVIIIIILIL